jgi:hypothetical protein
VTSDHVSHATKEKNILSHKSLFDFYPNKKSFDGVNKERSEIKSGDQSALKE